MIDPDKDPLGQAIVDYFKGNKEATIDVYSELAGKEQILASHLFRDLDEMPELEKIAFTKARGHVLDIGAGAGCHSILLQKMGMKVTAIDHSPGAVQVMRERGINVIPGNVFELKDKQFDTLLMLMNGIGIVGDLNGLERFLVYAKQLLSSGGQIIMDSADIKYLYEEEDGSILLELTRYYGEMAYELEYNTIKSDPFKWLYVESNTLQQLAQEHGYTCQIVYEGKESDYLAILSI